MDTQDVEVGVYASSLRRKLFQEHLGLLEEPMFLVIDPISDSFYKVSLLTLRSWGRGEHIPWLGAWGAIDPGWVPIDPDWVIPNMVFLFRLHL